MNPFKLSPDGVLQIPLTGELAVFELPDAELAFDLAHIPEHATFAVVFTPHAGGEAITVLPTVIMEEGLKTFLSARFTPPSIGRWSFKWTARDAGEVIGTYAGVFDVIDPSNPTPPMERPS